MAAALAVSLAAGAVQAADLGTVRLLWDVRSQRPVPPGPARRPRASRRRTSPSPSTHAVEGFVMGTDFAAGVAAILDRDLRALRRELEAYRRRAADLAGGTRSAEHRRHARAASRRQPAALHRRALGGHRLRAGPGRGVRPTRACPGPRWWRRSSARERSVAAGCARVTPEELREDYPEPIAESHVRTGGISGALVRPLRLSPGPARHLTGGS